MCNLSAVLSEKPSFMTLSHGWCFGTLVDWPPSLSAFFPEREDGYFSLQNSPDPSSCSELWPFPAAVKPSLISRGCRGLLAWMPQESPLDDPAKECRIPSATWSSQTHPPEGERHGQLWDEGERPLPMPARSSTAPAGKLSAAEDKPCHSLAESCLQGPEHALRISLGCPDAQRLCHCPRAAGR